MDRSTAMYRTSFPCTGIKHYLPVHRYIPLCTALNVYRLAAALNMPGCLSAIAGRKVGPRSLQNAFLPKRRVVSRQISVVRVQAKKVAVLGAGAQQISILMNSRKMSPSTSPSTL
jgi:hypothetical protein